MKYVWDLKDQRRCTLVKRCNALADRCERNYYLDDWSWDQLHLTARQIIDLYGKVRAGKICEEAADYLFNHGCCLTCDEKYIIDEDLVDDYDDAHCATVYDYY